VGSAKRRIAVSLGGDRPKVRTIALDDLVYYFVGVLDDPCADRQYYDIENDEVLSINQLIASIADRLARHHPIKLRCRWRS
jgi:nucleoside-diphosphate-sugar epimerase